EHLLENSSQKPLHHLHDLLAGHEGHLQIDLGEFGLPVEAEVLVAEALDDLEVAVEAADHVELLEELGAFGQGVKRPRVEARRNVKVARPARRGTHEKGRLQLPDTTRREIVARDLVDAGARVEDPLHRRPPQVEVAVTETELLARLHLVTDDEWRG